MGKVKYATGIDYVSGAMSKPTKKEGHSCGTYLIGTHRIAPTTNANCNRLYIKDNDAFKRVTPPSADELALRNRFRAVSQAVAARAKDLSKITADQAAWRAQLDQPGAAKTLKKWYWMVECEAYDQQH